MERGIIKGIYLIERICGEGDTGEPFLYIGQAKDIFSRMAQHFDGSGQFIDKSIKKAGCESFRFRILEVVKKESDRDIREKFWITRYTEQFGEKALYNNESGGKKGKTKINSERTSVSAQIKKEIQQLFEQETGRSIYAIAEKYGLKWEEVLEIRKPFLKRNGLKWNKKSKAITDLYGNIPPDWNGGRLTEKQYHSICHHKNKDDRDAICKAVNVSISDLQRFYEETEETDTYKPAEPV